MTIKANQLLNLLGTGEKVSGCGRGGGANVKKKLEYNLNSSERLFVTVRAGEGSKITKNAFANNRVVGLGGKPVTSFFWCQETKCKRHHRGVRVLGRGGG